jgi:cell shape-determining protein MreC
MAKREQLSARWVLLTLMALSVLTAASGRPFSQRLRRAFRFVLVPVSDVSMHVTTAFRRNIGGAEAGELTAEQAAELKRRMRLLEQRAVDLQKQMLEYRGRMRELENFQDVYRPARHLKCVLIPARVVAAESLPYGSGRMVSAGRRRGVLAGDQVTTRNLMTDRMKALGNFGVIANNALVGRIVESGEFTARMILVTDTNFKIPALIKRDLSKPRKVEGESSSVWLTKANYSDVDGIAFGDGTESVIVRKVPQKYNVLPGDVVWAKWGTIMARDVRIGTVTKVVDDDKAKKAGFKKVIVTPDADLSSLRDVYVIYSPGRPGGAN